MTQAPDIGRLADRQAIADCIVRHSCGLDRADQGLLDACYHDDATVDYGFFCGPAREFCAILPEALRAQAVTMHRTSQMWIAAAGDRARSESYVIAYSQSADADGAMKQRLIGGRYLDRLTRRAGVWRLAHRSYVMDVNANWDGQWSPGDLPPLASHLPRGGHGTADAGQAILGQFAARNRMKMDLGGQGMSNPDQTAINDVIARQAIADLTAAYCRGVDRADESLLKSVFHEDSVVVSGAFNGGGHQFAAEICRVVKAVFNQTFHSIANQWIEITGDTAVGETYVITISTMSHDDGSQSEMLTGGRYLDRFEQRGGIWKIAERGFVCDWNRVDATTHSNDGLYAPLDRRGKQGPDDPVYALWQ